MVYDDEFDQYLAALSRGELERQLKITKVAVEIAKLCLDLTTTERLQVTKSLMIAYLMDKDTDEEDAAEAMADVMVAEVGILENVPALVSNADYMCSAILERLAACDTGDN